jgi:hypothetical protein
VNHIFSFQVGKPAFFQMKLGVKETLGTQQVVESKQQEPTRPLAAKNVQLMREGKVGSSTTA